jgi:hypothetical protein
MIFAYIDPGSGSLFIQSMVGVAVASTFVLRNFVRTSFAKVVQVVSKKPVESVSQED